MARDDLIQFNGTVKSASGGGHYGVMLENGVSVLAKLNGKMKQFKIRVVVGDHVTVALSPYDPTHGLITHRLRGALPQQPNFSS
jgi:translation initiation factor IF-1